jgi:hypothetical protein
MPDLPIEFSSDFIWKRDLSRRLPLVIFLSIVQRKLENFLKIKNEMKQPSSGYNFKRYMPIV